MTTNKLSPWTLILCLSVLVTGPVFAQKVSVDFDDDYDFSKATTVAWMEGTPAQNELMQGRIIDAIEGQLKAKGLTLIEEGTPDLYITSHAGGSTQTKSSGARVGIGFSKRVGKASVGVGTSTGGKTKTVTTGTLLIELRDVESGSLVWQATASDTMKDEAEKNEKIINSAVEKAFKDYPPKAKKK